MNPPTPPALPAELTAVLQRLRLPYIRRAAPEVLATARAQRWDPAEVLRVLLTDEAVGRDAATRAMRRRAAGFPAGKTLASRRETESAMPLPTQHALATLEWLGRAENLVLCGPSGTGKTHYLEGLAGAAIEAGRRVAWFSLESLTATLGRAKVDGSTGRVVARICRSELATLRQAGWGPPGSIQMKPPQMNSPEPR
jgi:DNA replication protein DnaC